MLRTCEGVDTDWHGQTVAIYWHNSNALARGQVTDWLVPDCAIFVP
jgi:hypothetical protein